MEGKISSTVYIALIDFDLICPASYAHILLAISYTSTKFHEWNYAIVAHNIRNNIILNVSKEHFLQWSTTTIPPKHASLNGFLIRQYKI